MNGNLRIRICFPVGLILLDISGSLSGTIPRISQAQRRDYRNIFIRNGVPRKGSIA